MDVQPDKEDLFNEVYDTEHVPLLSKVPGVVAVTRLELQPLTRLVDGKPTEVPSGNATKFTALYEIEDPSVLVSPEWMAAAEQGRWPTMVRPYTKNRQHLLRKVMG
jgi:hypothetical protein